MTTRSNLNERLSLIEKQLNKRPKKISALERAALVAEARKLLEESRRLRNKESRVDEFNPTQLVKNCHGVESVPESLPTPQEPELSLDEFATWIGDMRDED
ncbi:hypothetical protein [Chroococcidiopsis thermalis]|uniref:Uncharacterized protein n=1 Tax=Chroococcidiopsis thermalis (strain PCC 7203) TaxID=251229 RepID=K9TV27_CHRTP|nr:hypothetical protein [Chroococcidiopsis thermalis]AFY86702.1 hypothetical protein Chro_1175 [Chroococcidiopsis thermalis PCC 7203]